mmetsp:Transcript_101275/g.253893  ORF Transcript_101275/g.253893 Transcript_101275/m.253893 type:complete len:211 (-) Transcript_101275:639-1271(-)
MVVHEAGRLGVSDQVLGPQTEHSSKVLALLVGDLRRGRLAAHCAISDGEHLSRHGALHTQTLIHQQAAAVRLSVLLPDLLAHCLREGAHAHPCNPHQHAIVHFVHRAILLLQAHGFAVHLLHHGVKPHVDALADEVVLHVLPNTLVEHGQQTRQRLHKCDLEVRSDLWIAPLQVLFNEVGKLTAEFDPGGSTSHHDKVQQLLDPVQITCS